MLRRLRRNPTRDSNASVSACPDTVLPSRASLLGLPPELRNAIYEHLAASTTLRLASAMKKRKKPQPAGLLLVSKQMLREYEPILLANAQLVIRIYHLDFRPAIDGIDGLRADTLDRISSNKRLTLQLALPAPPTTSELISLSDWLSYRAPSTAPGTGDPSSTSVVSPGSFGRKPSAYSLHFHYTASIKPSRMTSGGLADPVNVKVVLLSTLLRVIPGINGKGIRGEKRQMMLDLADYKDELLGLEKLSPKDADERVVKIANDSDALEVIRRSYLPIQLR